MRTLGTGGRRPHPTAECRAGVAALQNGPERVRVATCAAVPAVAPSRTPTTPGSWTTPCAFVGQRFAAVVADSEAAAEEGCRRVEVLHEVLPAVLDPESMRPGAPVVDAKDGAEARIARSLDNVGSESHGEIGSVQDGFAASDVVYDETFRTQRVQHASP